MTEICHRWKDFSKPVQAYQALNVFGGNIVSAEGAVWQRHRKITAPPFNERNSRYAISMPRKTLKFV